jgi:hypothetical protein
MRTALLVLALAFAVGARAQPAPTQEAFKAEASKPEAKAEGKPAAKKAAKAARKPKGPQWAELSADHQMILAPLKADWENLEPERKQKWIGLAKRYPKMKPQAQERVQKRMHDWANLTPEQRRQARENYRQMAKVPPEKRKNIRAQWAEYQQLSPAERSQLQYERVDPPAPKKKKAP